MWYNKLVKRLRNNQKERGKLKMKKLSKIFTVVSVIFFIWLALSWIDVIADNGMPNPQHSKYNLIGILIDLYE